jgi:hypothetical protein
MKHNHRRSGMLRRLGLLVPLMYCLMATATALAEPAFRVDNVAVDKLYGVYNLDAAIDYDLTPPVQEALLNGVDLVFEMQIEVYRWRGWLPDYNIAVLSQRYRLVYHALSQQFVVQNLNTGVQHTFPDLYSALDHQGLINNLPVLDASLLKADERYYGRLRVVLALNELPLPMRFRAYTSGDWRLSSPWRRWEVP